ncbi:TetR/AcrR family transcriptional regulator [Phyllobacterium sp. 628]|uniref:TetR/AcrR family transcriptional regulator n=1 Tax=Phyllobacterium sp. 628 TaxID=2718938 RepID=UPI0016627C42|nr:TetR/AcrR family transcriptional regulator [Phyllobacterium sp. 628]QND53782.1 TetR/AcrR family transcriptional regulator [Phyllobacterium sp. 628]
MRVSREQAAENRTRIIDIAGQQFREKGFDGIGVADVMKSAGLTHGGFYGHFESKEDLIAEACAAAMAVSVRRWTSLAQEFPDDTLAAITKSYLSGDSHGEGKMSGCMMAALAPDVARRGGAVRSRFTEGTKSLLGILVNAVTARSKARQREKAIAIMAGLVGTVVLSRAVDDPEFSAEIKRVGQQVFGEQEG